MIARRAILRNLNRDPGLYQDQMERCVGLQPALYGSCLEMYNSTENEVLVSGPAGTGKTVGCLRKVHDAMMQYPNARALFVRKKRIDLVEAAMVTFEEDVLGKDNPLTFGPTRLGRHGYVYPNGSQIIIGGLDKLAGSETPSRIMSTQYDLIYVQEAVELTESEWEGLATRNRNGKMPYQQLIADTNPDAPEHWLHKRCKRGATRILYSTHEDNPRYWDMKKNTWTEAGIAYVVGKLDKLTGTRKLRLRDGKWVQSEGVVFDNFNEQFNVTEDAEYNPTFEVTWFVDDGYVHGDGPGYSNYHPRVILFAQYTPMGGVNVFAEYYKTLEVDHMLSIRTALSYGYPKPTSAYVDSSAAQFMGALWNAGIYTYGATHPVVEGIKNLRRLIADENGVRLFRIHPRCDNLIQEFLSYRYDKGSKAAQVGEPAPLKVDDHGPSACRYGTWWMAIQEEGI